MQAHSLLSIEFADILKMFSQFFCAEFYFQNVQQNCSLESNFVDWSRQKLCYDALKLLRILERLILFNISAKLL